MVVCSLAMSEQRELVILGRFEGNSISTSYTAISTGPIPYFKQPQSSTPILLTLKVRPEAGI